MRLVPQDDIIKLLLAITMKLVIWNKRNCAEEINTLSGFTDISCLRAGINGEVSRYIKSIQGLREVAPTSENLKLLLYMKTIVKL